MLSGFGVMEGASTERENEDLGEFGGRCGNLVQWKLHGMYEVDPSKTPSNGGCEA